jgi:hypothetical protein
MEVQRIQYVVSSQLLRVLFPTVSHRLSIIDYRLSIIVMRSLRSRRQIASASGSASPSASVVFVFVF